MGVELILKTKEDEINIGRADNYFCTESDAVELMTTAALRLHRAIFPYIGYSPKDSDEVGDLTADIEEALNDFAEDCVKIGRTYLLYQLKENGFEVRED